MAAMPSLLQLAKPQDGRDIPALAALKSEAKEALAGGLDWPGPKTPGWRNTRLTGLGDSPWQVADGDALASREAADLPLPPPRPGYHRLVMVDGLPAWGLCQLPLADSGTYVADLCEGLRARPDLAQLLDGFGLRQKDAFAALNMSHARHGALVHVAAKGPKVAPLELLFVSTGALTQALVQPRVLVVVDGHAEADIVETHLGLGDTRSWTNAFCELHVYEGAHLRYGMQQQEGSGTHHVARLCAHLHKDATLNLATCDRGSVLGRRDLHIALCAPGAHAQLTHVVLGRGQQHLDTHALVRHLSPHTTCKQNFRAVLDGHSTAIFDGLIDIVPQAQKISAQQMSRSLVLSPGAQAIIKPQMVILADDVKCTHGATIGELDEDAYFYLTSRGIDGRTAKQMLTFAFLAEALSDLPAFLQQPIMAEATQWLDIDAAISVPVNAA